MKDRFQQFWQLNCRFFSCTLGKCSCSCNKANRVLYQGNNRTRLFPVRFSLTDRVFRTMNTHDTFFPFSLFFPRKNGRETENHKSSCQPR
jgi:hypothetical protein